MYNICLSLRPANSAVDVKKKRKKKAVLHHLQICLKVGLS